jgi:hypothetical protein
MSAVDAKSAEQNPGANAGVLLPTRGTTMMSLAQCFDTAFVLGRLARGIADTLAVHRADLIGQHRAVADINRIESICLELARGVSLSVAGISPDVRATIWPNGSRHPDILASLQ